MKTKTVNVLWTGGFDSTFRIFQLSKLPVTVQPYYLAYKQHKSTVRELATIEKITQLIQDRETTRFRLLPLIVKQADSLDVPEDVREAYQKIREMDIPGEQYAHLAVFAGENPGMELPVARDKGRDMARGYIEVEDAITGKNFVIDREKTPPVVYTLMKDLLFPVCQWSKAEMKAHYKQENAREIMKASRYGDRLLCGNLGEIRNHYIASVWGPLKRCVEAVSGKSRKPVTGPSFDEVSMRAILALENGRV